jgi:molecular chaperone GrpE
MSDATTPEVVEELSEVIEEAPGQETDPVAELTAALQQERASFINYKKKAEQDRLTLVDLGVGKVLTELLDVLDAIDSASTHGELTGGFKSVADQVNAITTRFGLEKYGVDGEAFDPQIHDALMHETSPDVAVPTATKILQPGFKHKDRILRHARVLVTDPE